MGVRYEQWSQRQENTPNVYEDVTDIIRSNREFVTVDQLSYGDHGLNAAKIAVIHAIKNNKKIALYADYDVDGTMSCVSWVWFFRAIGFQNFVYYIPDRFTDGYGLNMAAMEHLIDEKHAELIITMDTGITANQEAAYCRSRGVEFICTDHHKVQPDKMPDCIILNPKTHPDMNYQELCGCGITFVLLRQLGAEFAVDADVWTDLLALTGMATICDVVPLNGVNHKLAQMGVAALKRSKRPVLRQLMQASSLLDKVDEKDVGFRLGPRINAVGRLEHAKIVVEAFINENSEELIKFMGICNEKRKTIQGQIVDDALAQAKAFEDDPILFLGGDWHQGVVGIAASKVAETYWKPTWLFQRKDGVCKGSARSIAGFDVTDAMSSCKDLFQKFGGHQAAGGFSFAAEHEAEIRKRLQEFAQEVKKETPSIWKSSIRYDCALPTELATLSLADSLLELKPFGHGFEEPLFLIRAKVDGCHFYNDKVTKKPKHTALSIVGAGGLPEKVMFFNAVYEDLAELNEVELLVTASHNTFRGVTRLQLMGVDYRACN